MVNPFYPISGNELQDYNYRPFAQTELQQQLIINRPLSIANSQYNPLSMTNLQGQLIINKNDNGSSTIDHYMPSSTEELKKQLLPTISQNIKQNQLSGSIPTSELQKQLIVKNDNQIIPLDKLKESLIGATQNENNGGDITESLETQELSTTDYRKGLLR